MRYRDCVDSHSRSLGCPGSYEVKLSYIHPISTDGVYQIHRQGALFTYFLCKRGMDVNSLLRSQDECVTNSSSRFRIIISFCCLNRNFFLPQSISHPKQLFFLTRNIKRVFPISPQTWDGKTLEEKSAGNEGGKGGALGTALTLQNLLYKRERSTT